MGDKVAVYFRGKPIFNHLQPMISAQVCAVDNPSQYVLGCTECNGYGGRLSEHDEVFHKALQQNKAEMLEKTAM